MLNPAPVRDLRARLVQRCAGLAVLAACIATLGTAPAAFADDPTPVPPTPTPQFCVPVVLPPPAPVDVAASGVSTADITSLGDRGASTATISWTAPTLGNCDSTIDHYVVTAVATGSTLPNAALPANPEPVSTTGTSISLPGLFGGTVYSITVASVNATPRARPGEAAPITVTTPVAAFAPTTYSSTVSGGVTLKRLLKGTVPLTGTGTASVRGTAFTGSFAFAPSTDSTPLIALGFVPVTAEVSVRPTSAVTGTLIDGVLNASLKARISITKFKVFGVTLFAGATCQTAQVSTIPLTSVGTYSVASGGNLAGTFSISNLTGCGGVNGLVSSLTAGGGNALSLQVKGGPPAPQA